MSNIYGVGPGQPVVTTPQGGKHSATPYAFHLIDAKALFAVAKVLQEGARNMEQTTGAEYR